MAQARSNYEGIYASPNSSWSSSYSELGLTLLPSPHSDTWREDHGHGCLQSGQNQGGQPLEGTRGALSYPSPTFIWGSIARTHDLLKHPVNASNGGIPKQSLSIVADDQPTTTPLFVQLRSIDRSGRISHDEVTPTFVTAPVLYQPSAPHLHVIVSTGTTLAAATQIDHLKARNKQLTMDRDKFYHLSKPATRRADDGKSEQIRQLNAELKAALEQNSKIQWALETQTARAQAAYQSASSYKAQLEALQAAYSTFVTGNPWIPTGERSVILGPSTISEMRRPSAYINLTSPTKPAALQQLGPQNRTTSSLAAVMPAMASPARPSTPANGPPAKRQRLSSSTENQPQKQHSMLNGSQMTDIQARLRQELRGRTGSHAWTNEAENANGVEATTSAGIAREEAEDELSESEIAAFDRALEEDGDGEGEGDGDSLFGDGFFSFGEIQRPEGHYDEIAGNGSHVVDVSD
jgi:hypothetical protein